VSFATRCLAISKHSAIISTEHIYKIRESVGVRGTEVRGVGVRGTEGV